MPCPNAFVKQVSGSFFDDFRGEMTSMAENFENFVSDVIYDVRETIDCSILAVKQVLALGNADSAYYNENCKTTDDESDSQEDTNVFPSIDGDTSAPTEILEKEDQYVTANIPELTETVKAKKKPILISEENKLDDNDIKVKNKLDFGDTEAKSIKRKSKNERRNNLRKIPNHSEKGKSTNNIEQDFQVVKPSISPVVPVNAVNISTEIGDSKINISNRNLDEYSDKIGKIDKSKAKSTQSKTNKAFYNNLNVSESAGTPVNKNSTDEDLPYKLHSLIDTHKKLEHTKSRLENKTKDKLDKLHTLLRNEIGNLTASVIKEIQKINTTDSPPVKMINVDKKPDNETMINSYKSGIEKSRVEHHSNMNHKNQTNNITLLGRDVDTRGTVSRGASYKRGELSVTAKKLVNEKSILNSAKESSNVEKQEQNKMNIKQVLQDRELLNQNKSKEPTNNAETNLTSHYFGDRNINSTQIKNDKFQTGKDNNTTNDISSSFRDVPKKIMSQPKKSTSVTNKMNDKLDYYSDDDYDDDYYDDDPIDYQDYNDLFQTTDDVESREKAAEHVKELMENSKRSEKIINDYLKIAEKRGISTFNETEA